MNFSTKRLLLGGLLVSLITAGTSAEAASETQPTPIPNPNLTYAKQLSANVPLNSYVYDSIAKLDGLGYLTDMQTGTKPYTRMQVAKWILQIENNMSRNKQAPTYAKALLDQLKTDFKEELDTLTKTACQDTAYFHLKSIGLETTFYNGASYQNAHTGSSYQPLHINDNGTAYGEKLNGIFDVQLEGKINEHTLLSLTPRFFSTEKDSVELESSYVKTHVNNLSIQLGKDAMWWGQGSRGSLLFTNNAAPQTAVKLSNIEPNEYNGLLKFLGKSNTTLFYSVLEENRTPNYPSLFGLRKDFTPSENFTFSMSKVSIVGGKGHMLSGSDYVNFFTGKNANTANIDEWDSIAGFDFRLRLPQWNGMQVYGEIYGEDQAHALKIIPIPSELAETVGLYLPRLSKEGDWDLTLEWAHTRPSWYVHSLYAEGYTYKGNVMGDAMGTGALRYYAKLGHYMEASQLSFNVERVIQDFSADHPQTMDSFWLEWKMPLEKDVYLESSLGLANIKNAGSELGETKHNYLASIKLTKAY